MPPDLPKTTIKFITALLKHQAKLWLGEDAAGIAAGTLIDEDLQKRLDDWLNTEQTAKQLLDAAEQAHVYVQDEANCPDADLRGAFHGMRFDNLSSVQAALTELTGALDSKKLQVLLHTAFTRDLPNLSPAQHAEGARIYTDALLRAVGTLEKFASPILLQIVLDLKKGQYAQDEKLNRIIILLQEKIQSHSQNSPTLPGDLPPDSSCHHSRDDMFVNRDEILKKLALMISTKRRTIVISGLIGVGKTALAIEFAYRYGYQYQGVHWLDLGAVNKYSDFENQIKKITGGHNSEIEIIRKWKENGPRLIILDRFENISLANEILARLQHSSIHILILSCQSSWSASYGLQKIELDELSIEASSSLLVRLFPTMDKATTKNTLGQLGNLPLAIKSYFNRTNGNPANTIEYGKKMKRISYLHDLMSRLEASYSRLSLLAKKVFMTAGYLLPDTPIPTSVFDLTLGVSIEKIDEALDLLKNEGLIKWDGKQVVVNPLLSEYSRHKCEEELQNILIARALRDTILQMKDDIDMESLRILSLHQENLDQILADKNDNK